MNLFLKNLLNWLYANKLSPNSEKTFLMLFTNKIVYNLPDIYFGNDLLQWTESIKYLGFIVDSKLNFNQQLHNVSSKISKSSGIIYRLKNSCQSLCF